MAEISIGPLLRLWSTHLIENLAMRILACTSLLTPSLPHLLISAALFLSFLTYSLLHILNLAPHSVPALSLHSWLLPRHLIGLSNLRYFSRWLLAGIPICLIILSRYTLTAFDHAHFILDHSFLWVDNAIISHLRDGLRVWFLVLAVLPGCIGIVKQPLLLCKWLVIDTAWMIIEPRLWQLMLDLR